MIRYYRHLHLQTNILDKTFVLFRNVLRNNSAPIDISFVERFSSGQRTSNEYFDIYSLNITEIILLLYYNTFNFPTSVVHC